MRALGSVVRVCVYYILTTFIENRVYTIVTRRSIIIAAAVVVVTFVGVCMANQTRLPFGSSERTVVFVAIECECSLSLAVFT